MRSNSKRGKKNISIVCLEYRVWGDRRKGSGVDKEVPFPTNNGIKEEEDVCLLSMWWDRPLLLKLILRPTSLYALSSPLSVLQFST